MKPIGLKNAAKSLLFYKRASVNQIIIVLLLATVITGSLFTGYSVRRSLEQKAEEALGNTGILISSGLRFVNPSLAERIAGRLNESACAIIETDGYVQNFTTGATALNAKIYGVNRDFFTFQGMAPVDITPGTVAINDRLASQLGIGRGDELIIRFREIDPLPSNAPFAPSKDSFGSMVLKVGKVLDASQAGNFSLGISQIVPMNVFMNLNELSPDTSGSKKANRILIANIGNYPDSTYSDLLSKLLTIKDIGLSIRKSEKTGEPELISDRIFIDSLLVRNILQKIPSGRPVITYLANSIRHKERSAPYSFVSAIPASYSGIKDNETIINEWLAKDIGANKGDTLDLTWYDPGSGKLLEEKSGKFIVAGIINSESMLSDPSFMPDFPGISGSTSCSGWNAGVPILLDRIRDKDEEYWNKFRGTPKAFIGYNKGVKIWGNNFGSATAIRFPQSMNPDQIASLLDGSLDQTYSGITVTNILERGRKAAETGTDFSSLFLSLGIFIIISCIILLSLAVSTFFDTKREQVRTYNALGFKRPFIRRVLFLECMFLSLAGTIPGIFTGFFINNLIIKALNSVWKGAVQTNTISAHFGLLPLLYGFSATIIITAVLILMHSNALIRRIQNPERAKTQNRKPGLNVVFLIFSFVIATFSLIFSFILKNSSTVLAFVAGSLYFAAFVLILRQFYLKDRKISDSVKNGNYFYSRKFYSFHPSHAIAPVIFIAAGIFAVIVTGANRQVLTKKMLLPSGGTGGYLLWAETEFPIAADLNTPGGRKEFGLDDPGLADLKFVQAGRVAGDDASCLNLNHVTSPPLLGLDPEEFISKGAFSFVTVLKSFSGQDPWSLLQRNPDLNTIYGIADQTVLQWGLKIKTGDTLKYRSETGQPLNIIVGGGLKSSVFQGYILISRSNLSRYFPSVAGSSVFLADGNPEYSGKYTDVLSERLASYGPSVETAGEKLSSFFAVTNTYLNVFTILGAFGMILGVAGMGFILIRNFNQRKREFALMMATGYSIKKIRKFLLNDQIIIVFWGILTGTLSGLVSTLPSLMSGSEIPWKIIVSMVLAVAVVGSFSLILSVQAIKGSSLVTGLRKE